MTKSLEKEIYDIVLNVSTERQAQAILLLIKTQMWELQEMLKEREFSTGNWTEEMNYFVDAYIDNL